MFTFHAVTSYRAIGLCMLGAMVAVSALAAGEIVSASAHAQYLQDRAACLGGQSNEGLKPASRKLARHCRPRAMAA